MNILLIDHYAGSVYHGMEFRPYYFARNWVKSGCNVSVAAADYSHLRQKNPAAEKDFTEEDIDGIRYYWIKTKKYKGNGVNRAISMAQFVAKIILRAKWLCARIKPDIVIASSTYPMDGYAARAIRKASGAKYIHEIHDMWPATLIEIGGMSRAHPFVLLNQIAEDAFCKNADAVVSVPPATKEYLVAHGMKEKKFHHIPNGVVEEDLKNPDPLPRETLEVIDRLKRDNKFLIVFAGSHNEAYGLEYLIRAVRELRDDRVRTLFVGDGYLKNALMKDTEQERERFTFLPPVAKAAVPALLEQADAIYVSGTKDNLFKFGISMNKLTDAMASGRPILYAVNAPNNYIRDYKCGVSVPPRDASALAGGIKKLLDMSDEERNIMGANGKSAALKYFEYKRLSDAFLNVMKEVGGK